jgi:hypothetical protein
MLGTLLAVGAFFTKGLKMHVEEPIELVTYLDRKVPKKGFRAYIYSNDGRRKLINSYDEFLTYTSSDDWFSTKEEAQTKKPRKKTEG